jgi:hypothetical protein
VLASTSASRCLAASTCASDGVSASGVRALSHRNPVTLRLGLTPMGRASSKIAGLFTPPAPDVVVRAARPDEAFYTWRGRLRTLHEFDCRLVLNAYAADALVGSALLRSRETGPDDPSSIWTFVDSEFDGRGPYFGDPALIADASYIHLQSVYVRRDHRRRGVSIALCEAIRRIGLPTFCQFRPKFLPGVFERYRADSHENELLAFDWTWNGDGGSLASAMSLAMDDAVESAEPSTFSPGEITAEIGMADGGPDLEPRDVDGLDVIDDDSLDVGKEGEVEDDVVSYPSDSWREEDRCWVPRQIEDELRYRLERERSGFSISELRLETVEPLHLGETTVARFRAVFGGAIEDPDLFELRARYRHYLCTFDPTWHPADVPAALREIVRLQYPRVEGVRTI